MKGCQTAEDVRSSLPSIHVVIVNYGTATLALDAAASALSQSAPNRSIRVHILDNASPGDDASVLATQISMRGWQDRVTFHAERTNHGFGRGNNIVLSEIARNDPDSLVLLLNPDARLEPEALARLADTLDTRPDVAAVGAQIARPDGKPVSAAFRFPSLLGEFEAAACFGPISRMLARHRIPLPESYPEGPVDWVVGAVVLLRISALRRIGLFDPGFFLYYEEVDLMRRLKRHGFVVWHQPSARAKHYEGASTGIRAGNTARRPSYWFHSWQLYHRRASGRAGAIVTALAHLAGTAINLLQAKLRGKPPAAPPRYLRDFASGALLPLLLQGGGRND